MDRANSVSSNGQRPNSGTFAYQTRLLERTSSQRSTASTLSRSSSASSRAFQSPTSTGSSGTHTVTRRWTPSHRSGTSLDFVRGKFEERAKTEAILEGKYDPSDATEDTAPSPTKESFHNNEPQPSRSADQPPFRSVQEDSPSTFTPSNSKRHTLPAPIIASPLSPNTTGISVVSPDPPSSSGLSSAAVNRIRLPNSNPSPASIVERFNNVAANPELTPTTRQFPRAQRSNTLESTFQSARDAFSKLPEPTSSTYNPPRSIPLRTRPASISGFSSVVGNGAPSPLEDLGGRPLRSYTRSARSISPEKLPADRTPPPLSTKFGSQSPSQPPPEPSVPSVMAPRVYRSSYMANKKGTYGESLTAGRRFGRHLPRIASGDANDDWVAEEPEKPLPSPVQERPSPSKVRDLYLPPSSPEKPLPSPVRERPSSSKVRESYLPPSSPERPSLSRVGEAKIPPSSPERPSFDKRSSVSTLNAFSFLDEEQQRRQEARERRRQRVWDGPGALPAVPTSPTKQDIIIPSAVLNPTSDVAGIPGRLKLSRKTPAAAAATPLPSSRLTRGLWADTQRHLIQAYEYLCHVGEAQQWIEGCISQELGFGVVEMEEELRNGIVLAKLVRRFKGEAGARRIYEARKLDFRHSDNINYFFDFVRHDVGLPECFIFELTDLYEKKNIPKVIYCIHALSHLLARRGMAERIGNLLGQLQFSDDQLQRTQKGLKDAGVPMPNFSNVGRELAKEINEEPEEEPETEDERRDRLLLENEESIVGLQTMARAFLARKSQATLQARLRLAERYGRKIQAQCRGFLVRGQLQRARQQHTDNTPRIIAIQAAARAVLARRAWYQRLRRVHNISVIAVKVQAQGRGIIQRRRFRLLKGALQRSSAAFVKLQSIARARVVRKSYQQVTKTFSQRIVMESIVDIQAACRGVLARRRVQRHTSLLQRIVPEVVGLQAQARGVLERRRIGRQLAKLDDISDVIVRIQAAARTYLARKRLLVLIRNLRKATAAIISVQTRARANLARQKHQTMAKALSEVKVVSSVNSFQARARAALARTKHRETGKKLEFVEPDVVGFQAVCRGALVRRDYYAWRDHLWASEDVAILLQALLRGAVQRGKFQAKARHYRENLRQVIHIQALVRAKETREQYRQLTLGTNVSVGTIKNFVHLLDDSETDFQEELIVEGLRKKVVQQIREVQTLENSVNELDTRIALMVNNAKTFEELARVKRGLGRSDGPTIGAARTSILAAHGDPFAGPSTLDHSAKRKLDLYQQLFYLLQTHGEYLAKLFLRVSGREVDEKTRRLTEHVALTLYGYGHAKREDYLLLKMFQHSVIQEIQAADTLADVRQSHPMYINIAVQYIRPKQSFYMQESLKRLILEVVEADDLDLEVDPSIIYRTRVSAEEMRTGVHRPDKDLPFYQALNDPDTRAEYIRHLQLLQWWSESFVTAIVGSTNKVPYPMRYLARETLAALTEKFPTATQEEYASCLGRLIYYRSINPAIITPETFDIVPSTINVESRKNLAQISRVLTQVCSGMEFGDDNPSFLPVNDFVNNAVGQVSAWLIEVANVPDVETQYHAHEFMDVTVQPKPIEISPNEVYSIHKVLSDNLDHLAPERNDPLRTILGELNGVPTVGSSELTDARDHPITLELTNRFSNVRDPHADEKALWVQAKRAVLAILRVQPSKDLVESLMQAVTEAHETAWDSILEDMEIEQHRQNRRMPSTTAADAAYRLEDIRSMTFREVKAHAIFYLLELEKQGKITRDDGYQGILDAIASDVRSKHRKRLDRQQEKEYMKGALKQLAERKKFVEEKIESYNAFVDGAMNTMQRGNQKKRFTLPFTRQSNHLRDLQRTGRIPQFGSFIYSAKSWYDKGILISVDKYSPMQFDKMEVILSSNSVGVFNIEIRNNALGISNRIAQADVKMEDLLQAQYQDRASLSLFNDQAKFHLESLLYQINKKFSA